MGLCWGVLRDGGIGGKKKWLEAKKWRSESLHPKAVHFLNLDHSVKLPIKTYVESGNEFERVKVTGAKFWFKPI